MISSRACGRCCTYLKPRRAVACKSVSSRDVQYLGAVGLSFDLCLRPTRVGGTRSAWWISARIRALSLITAGNADPQIVNGAAERDPANPFSHTKEQWQRDMAALAERGARSVQNIRDYRPGARRMERRRAGTHGQSLPRQLWTGPGGVRRAIGRCAT